MKFDATDLEQLRAIVRDAVREALASAGAAADCGVTIKTASRVADVEPSTIRAWLRAGLPHSGTGKRIRIRRDDLAAFLAKSGDQSPEQAARAALRVAK